MNHSMSSDLAPRKVPPEPPKPEVPQVPHEVPEPRPEERPPSREPATYPSPRPAHEPDAPPEIDPPGARRWRSHHADLQPLEDDLEELQRETRSQW